MKVIQILRKYTELFLKRLESSSSSIIWNFALFSSYITV